MRENKFQYIFLIILICLLDSRNVEMFKAGNFLQYVGPFSISYYILLTPLH